MSKITVRPQITEKKTLRIKAVGPAGLTGADGNDGADGAEQDISGKLDHTGGTATGIDEAVTTVVLTDGQDLTVDFDTNGLILQVDETVTSFTLTKGTWPDTTIAPMLVYIEEVGTGGSAPAITYAAGWGFHTLHTPDVADARTADTGCSQLELWRVTGVQFSKLVLEL